jgi:hypothetical protein
MAEPDPPIPILTALIELAQVQLTEAWAEVRDQNTYALALAALGIAVIGIVAAAQTQLGGDWWVPIPGLAVSSVVALFGTRRVRASLGPDPESFYHDHGATATRCARSVAFRPTGHANRRNPGGPPRPASRPACRSRAVRCHSGLFGTVAGVE